MANVVDDLENQIIDDLSNLVTTEEIVPGQREFITNRDTISSREVDQTRESYNQRESI